jgi:hypothetical protein
MARTTIDIETPILNEIRKLKRREHIPMGELISRLLAEAIANRSARAHPPTFRWTSQPMRALVDLEDKDSLHAAMDDREEDGA